MYIQLQNPEGQHKPSLSETSTTHDVHTGVLKCALIHENAVFSLLSQDFVLG